MNPFQRSLTTHTHLMAPTPIIRVLTVVGMLSVTLLAWNSAAAAFRTPTVDGTIAAGEYGTHSDGQNQQASGDQTWYMTWNNDTLFIGIAGANVAEGAVVYIDANPLPTPTGGTSAQGNVVGQPYDNTNFGQLPFRSDFVTYFKDGYREYRSADGTGAWSGAVAGYGSFASSGGTVREVAIPWSAITQGMGRPAAFRFFGYITSSGGFAFGPVPSQNPGGEIGTSATYQRFFNVPSTADPDATPPFAQNVASFFVNATGDIVGGATDDGLCGSGATASNCVLREAILESNLATFAGVDTIVFNIAGAGPHTIMPGGGLPAITQPVRIDGYTQAGASENTLTTGNNAVLRIVLNGASAGTANGLVLSEGSDGSTVRGLVINGFQAASGVDGDGIIVQSANNRIEGNRLGTNVDGTSAVANTGDGIHIVAADNNLIGGTTPAARNIISGSGQNGIVLQGEGAGQNVVQGNYIGTNAAGTGAIANTGEGIKVDQAFGNFIGGTDSGAGNLVSGNGAAGILLQFGGRTTIQGNLIGTNAAGNGALANGSNGVSIAPSSENLIGGVIAGAGNVISGNQGDGIMIEGSSSNQVQGNVIGTNALNATALGNGGSGITLNAALNNTIGGDATTARNVISNNVGDGILMQDSGASGNVVRNNLIGTTVDGTGDLGNGGNGVYLNDRESGAPNNNFIGAAEPGKPEQGNTIAFNGGGVVIRVLQESTGGTGNRIYSNSIYANGGIGIDLDDNGVTLNDAVPDADEGANQLQNFPVITSVRQGSTIVSGRLESAPSIPEVIERTYRLEFFASPSDGPQRFLGTFSVTTNENGIATFTDRVLPGNVSPGEPVVATATDTGGNTSEFSDGVVPTGDTPDDPASFRLYLPSVRR